MRPTIQPLALFLLVVLALPLTAAAAPRSRLQGIQPRFGPTAGGTAFELLGVGFDELPAGTLGVLFDAAAATNVVKASDARITGVTPPHPDRLVDVVITINGEPYREAGVERYRFTDRVVETTTTTTSDSTTTSTSTTLPAECGTGAAPCDDANRCTADACVPGAGCTHTLASGAADLTRESPSCENQPVPASVPKKFLKACTLIDGAERETSAKKRRAQLRKAVKQLSGASRAAAKAGRRKKNPLSGDCASGLAGVLGEAKARANALTGS